ncbi:SpaA isopeptide-forming pilin-related protein [Arcanobacterium canis]
MFIYRRLAAYLFASLLMFVGVVSISLPAQAAADIVVTSATELSDAVRAAGTKSTTIAVDGAIELDDTLTIPAHANITLVAHSEGATLQPVAEFTKSQLINAESDSTLTIGQHVDETPLTISAKKTALPLIYSRGVLIMNAGVVKDVEGDFKDAYSGAIAISGHGAQFTLNGGEIRDNHIGAASNQFSAGGVLVINGAKFLMNGGSVIMNWYRGTYTNIASGVGVFFSGEMEMNGGLISANWNPHQWGAGLLLHSYSGYWVTEKDWSDNKNGVKFTMTGGRFANNYAGRSGGAIATVGKVKVDIYDRLDDPSITLFDGNKAGVGGAISTYDWFVESGNAGKIVPSKGADIVGGMSKDHLARWHELTKSELNIHGGLFEKNTASAAGGAVYVGAAGASIAGGEFRENEGGQMGGAIYVASQPYTLHMSDVFVEGNKANGNGGGLWVCPTGDTVIYAQDGLGLAKNSGQAFGDDLSVFPYGSGEGNAPLQADFSRRQLGGGSADWFVDGYRNRQTQPRYSEQKIPYDLNKYVVKPEYIALHGVPIGDTVALARKNAKVHIHDNVATFGGGIATNGNIVFGRNKSTKIKVVKKWDESRTAEGLPDAEKVQIPERLNVELFMKLDGDEEEYLVDHATLTAQDQWTHVFRDLALTVGGKKARYVVRETLPEGWAETRTTQNVESDATQGATVTIENSYQPTFIQWMKQSNDGDFLGGATFTVTDPEGKTFDVLDNDARDLDKGRGGLKIHVTKNGRYQIREKVAPEGFELSDQVLSIEVNSGRSLTGRSFDAGKVINHRKPTPSLSWNKMDDNGNFLAGATFAVTGPGGVSFEVADNSQRDLNDADGAFEIEVPVAGKYTVIEKIAPEGYDLDATPLTVETDLKKPMHLGNVTNLPQRFLTWNKVDIDNKNLAGASFELSAPDGTVIQVTDNDERDLDKADGAFKVKVSAVGTYTLRETKAPHGYILNKDPQQREISSKDLIASFTKVVNKPIPTVENHLVEFDEDGSLPGESGSNDATFEEESLTPWYQIGGGFVEFDEDGSLPGTSGSNFGETIESDSVPPTPTPTPTPTGELGLPVTGASSFEVALVAIVFIGTGIIMRRKFSSSL